MQIKSEINNLQNYKKYLGVVNGITEYLDKKKYLRLDLPVLLPALIPESYLEIFETEYVYFGKAEKLYLTPSPELLIKRLISNNIGDCYYLGKAFRNSEPSSAMHSGEFTMLEMYKVGGSYMNMADEVLAMLQHIAMSFQNHEVPEALNTSNKYHINYQSKDIDLSVWEKMTVADAFQKYANIPAADLFDQARFVKIAQKKGYVTKGSGARVEVGSSKMIENFEYSYGELWSQIYANEVEPNLGNGGHPTLLYDYPVEFAALSKPNADGKTAQRFEFYIAGLEIGNCYSELTDWKLQEKRLAVELQERKLSGRIDHRPDGGFLDALKSGMPECTGIAIGVERLAMIFANTAKISDLKMVYVE